MGRIVPPFRQLYQEAISDLQMELKAALVDLGHKSAFDLLLKEAWNPEVAAMGNSTLFGWTASFHVNLGAPVTKYV
jgi:hypothetical protein